MGNTLPNLHSLNLCCGDLWYCSCSLYVGPEKTQIYVAEVGKFFPLFILLQVNKMAQHGNPPPIQVNLDVQHFADAITNKNNLFVLIPTRHEGDPHKFREWIKQSEKYAFMTELDALGQVDCLQKLV